MTFSEVGLAVVTIAVLSAALLLYLLVTRMLKADDSLFDKMYQNTRTIYAGVAERLSLRVIDTAPVADFVGRVPNFPILEGTIDHYYIVVSTVELQSSLVDIPASCIRVELPTGNALPAPRDLTSENIPTIAGRRAFSRLKTNQGEIAYLNDKLWVTVPQGWNLSIPAEIAQYARNLFAHDNKDKDSQTAYPLDAAILDSVVIAGSLATDLKET